MNSIYASLSLILAEIVLLLLIICGGVLFLKIREQRRDKQAVHALTEKLTSGKEDRLNILSIKLKDSLNLEGDELSAAAQEILEKENEFYSDVVKLYTTHDSSALEGLDQKVTGLAETYAKMGSAPAQNSSSASHEIVEELTTLRSENARIQVELESLQNTNEKLVQELEATRQEMRETVAEFVSAFSGGRDAAEEKMNGTAAAPTAPVPQSTDEQAESPHAQPETATETAVDDTELAAETSSEPEQADTTETPAAKTAEEAPETAAEASEATETPSPEGEDNPFLSIGETAAATDDSDDATSDRAMTDDLANDLDSDLGLDVNEEQLEITATAPPADQSVPDSDDIDALLAENSGETPPDQPEEAASTKIQSSEEELSSGDIDAILEGLESDAGQNDAATASDKTDQEISPDDIDAILEDIDIDSAASLNTENKESEKVTS